ncbi:hypothetical protein OU798_03530 [Prolixibacteraceae bacterium Z1-6]|uniref:Uncharacterized protein n=1 Tax=Draconibacterium aestuarii TaxID=2998507 RepID=A0A9X3F2N2_9BACT|nr:hypothetical protein [Prolixibacteraceae bacterium Z1-6]
MMIRVHIAFYLFLICCGIACTHQGRKNEEGNKDKGVPYILDMVHNNPGEEPTVSAYNDPEFVKARGYNGMVPQWYINCAVTYDNFEKGIVPEGSEERQWIEARASMIDEKLKACDAAGMNVYAFTDVFVAPRSVWAKYGEEMGQQETNLHGYGGDVKNVRKPNIRQPMIERLMRAQIAGIFGRFPSLDGLVIRFGETYLHDTPFHMGGKPVNEGEQGIKDHVKLINILREEVCVKRNKKLFYRTWDFGWFHTEPDVYLAITDQVEPHENLIFSIKHTKGDFLRTFPFNPTLGIGKHAQIVEAQCQREYEGKGAHPNYVAEAILNGFEEYEGMEGILGLNDLKSNPNLKGVWTWSRGGGWKGPYITNELWCDLNAYVLSQWAQGKGKTEVEIFNQYSVLHGLSTDDAVLFRKIAMLSSRGVLLGRSSKLTQINPWWIRDQFMGGLTDPGFNAHTDEAWGKTNKEFKEIVEKGLVDPVLEEKAQAVAIWKEMEILAGQLTTGDDTFRDYVCVSCAYGRIKYEIIEQAWTIMLKGLQGDKNETYNKEAVQKAFQKYELLWKEYNELKANNKQCATLYLPYGFNNHYKELHSDEGMDKAVRKYAEQIGKQ